MEKDNCRSLHPEERSNLEELKSKLPESVKNVVFSSKVCIKNVKFNEYLYAVDFESNRELKLNADDTNRRQVFTWGPGEKPTEHGIQQGLWEIEPDGYNLYIKNVGYHSEYLYAALDSLNYDEARRRVFTWTPQTKDSQSVWKLEPYGDNVYIMNVKQNEYLYATDFKRSDLHNRPI